MDSPVLHILKKSSDALLLNRHEPAEVALVADKSVDLFQVTDPEERHSFAAVEFHLL